MPYIPQKNRDELLTRNADNAGELNYLFTSLARTYIEDKGESYQNYNDIIGALEGCKLELYRRRVGQYEDLKIKDNGDVE
jgi:hypothetical protein